MEVDDDLVRVDDGQEISPADDSRAPKKEKKEELRDESGKKLNTFEYSYWLYNQGNTVEQIAEKRGLNPMLRNTPCRTLARSLRVLACRVVGLVNNSVLSVFTFLTLHGLCFILPSFFSTVTPGQLPTYSFEPVIALKSVVFPQLGLPASARRTGLSSSNTSFGQ